MAEYDLGPYRVRPRGEFNNSTIYHYLDVVTYNGGSYICCNLDSIDHDSAVGIKPVGDTVVDSTMYWQCIGSKGDKGDKGDTYIGFIEVLDGKWDYAESDKIVIPELGSDTLEINNAYDGCCGLILTTKELELPTNSEYSIDFNYVTRNATQYYMYTFVYGSCISENKKFIWNRTVINQCLEDHP